MPSSDPTYPLFPAVAFITFVLLLFVLTTNIVRQSWNFGVTLLVVLLCLQLLVDGINSIVWAYNADIKSYIYCDVGKQITISLESSNDRNVLISHLQVFTYVGAPASSILITRRLYKIASRRSTVPPSRKAVRVLHF